MKRNVFALVVILTLAAVATPRSTAKEIVELRLHGRYFSAPATVIVTVAVEPAADHRALIIEADGEHYFRSSAIELDGDKERRLHSMEFKSMPAGSYVLRAEVRSTERKVVGSASQDLIVTGVPGEH